jgi:hypothetical protein
MCNAYQFLHGITTNRFNSDGTEIQRQNMFYEAILTHALGLAEELNNRMEAKTLQSICAWVS